MFYLTEIGENTNKTDTFFHRLKPASVRETYTKRREMNDPTNILFMIIPIENGKL